MQTTKIEIKFNDKILAVAELGKSIVAGKEKPTLKITTVKAKHPYVNYYYHSEVERDQKLKAYSDRLIELEELKIQRRVDRKSEVQKFKDSLNVGDILTDSWGYDQTNVEFYKILEINEKRTKIKIQEMSHETVKDSHQTHGMACDVVPGECYGPIIEKPLLSVGIPIERSICLTKWDGRPKYKSWYY